MDVIEAIKKRQSLRLYKPQKVPRELIEKLVNCAQWAPSACNLQLTEYIVVDNEEILSKLAKKVTSKFNWSSTFIIFIYDSRFAVKRSSSMVSLGASMQNLLLAATSLDLSACPITGFKKDKIIKQILNIPYPYEIGLIMSIGYAKDENLLKQRSRLPLEKILHSNCFKAKGNALIDSLDLKSWTFKDIVNYRQRIAPVYLYNNHFNLHVFSKSVYQAAFEKIKRYLETHYERNKIKLLDLISYDCYFLKLLASSYSANNLTACDYFSFPLEVIKSKYPQIKTLLFKKDQSLPLPDSSLDIITLVHKIEFTPQVGALIKEAYRLLKPSGILYITTSREKLAKKIIYKMNFYKKKYLNKEAINVYENNPYYKIGPIKWRSQKFINKLINNIGFKRVNAGIETVPKSGIVPHCFFWGIYKKVPNK